MAKSKFRVGKFQVIAYRRRGEIIYRFGKVIDDCGYLRDYEDSKWIQGYNVLDGTNVFAVPINQMRLLTARERGDSTNG